MSARLIVFDVDGTLVDSQAQIVAAMTHAFDAHGLPVLPREAVLSIVGLSLPQAIAQLVPAPDVALHAALAQSYRDSFFAQRAKEVSPLYPGARAALDALAGRDDVILGVATGKARRGLDYILAAHGLAGLFRTTQVADNHPSKPHPSMLRAALAEAGVAPGQAVMIGDTTYDMEMARAAGTRRLGVAWGYHAPAALAETGADCVLDSFDALLPALERLWDRA